MDNQRVEFQTDICSYGEGEVIAHDIDTGSVTVREDDGTLWHGNEDQITPIVEDQ